MPFDIIGLGGSTRDVLTLMDEFPQVEGVVYPDAISMQGGGPVSTALVAASRLGCSTSMVDQIGDDWIGQQMLDEFQREGVGTALIKISAGHSSCVSNVLVRKRDGARVILHQRGDAPDVNPEQLPFDLLSQTRFLHLNGHHPEACLEAARYCQELEVMVSFDGGDYAGKRLVMRELIPLIDICIVAKQFALDFTGQVDLLLAGEQLYRLGPSVVGITDGTEGSWFWTTSGRFHQAAFVMPTVVDTTGCGDSFHGGFLAALCHGKSIRSAARWAAGVAALKTQQLGGRAALPNLETLLRFLESRD